MSEIYPYITSLLQFKLLASFGFEWDFFLFWCLLGHLFEAQIPLKPLFTHESLKNLEMHFI